MNGRRDNAGTRNRSGGDQLPDGGHGGAVPVAGVEHGRHTVQQVQQAVQPAQLERRCWRQVLVGVDKTRRHKAAGVAAVVARTGLADLADCAVVNDDRAPRDSVDGHVTELARG